jgi:hypothetical protein
VSRVSPLVAVALLVVLSLAPPARASEFEVTPFVGSLIPVQTLIMDDAGSAYFRMEPHKILGAAFGAVLSDRIALELLAGVGGGKFEITGTESFALGSAVWFTDLRGRLRIAGGDAAQIGLLAGLGYTQFRNGILDTVHEVDEDVEFKGTFTTLVGLGVRARLTDRVVLTVDGVDRIHKQGLESPNLTNVIEPTQHDMAVTAGLTFPLR